MPQSFAASTLHQLLQRVYGEYLEMPGLRLTQAQARRLWGLDEATADRVLAVLEDEKFLRRTSDDTYARTGVEV